MAVVILVVVVVVVVVVGPEVVAISCCSGTGVVALLEVVVVLETASDGCFVVIDEVSETLSDPVSCGGIMTLRDTKHT